MPPISVPRQTYIDTQKKSKWNEETKGEEGEVGNPSRWTINKNLIKQHDVLDLRNVAIREHVETILVHSTLVLFLI